jgi:uncharacterized protein with HEPN domain
VLAHGYFDVDLDILRAVLDRDVPELEDKVSVILKDMI